MQVDSKSICYAWEWEWDGMGRATQTHTNQPSNKPRQAQEHSLFGGSDIFFIIIVACFDSFSACGHEMTYSAEL